MESGQELRQAARTLSDELAAAQREGIPLAPADLRPSPPVSEAENAAPLYRELERRLNKIPEKERTARDQHLLRTIGGVADADERRLAAQTLAEWQPLLELAERIASRPRCDFQLQWEKVPEVSFPPYAPMRFAVRLLAVRALLADEDGRLGDALRDLQAAAQIGRHIGEEPILLSMIVQTAVADMIHRPLVLIIKRHGDEPAALRRIAEVSRACSLTPDLRHALRGEVIFSRGGLREPKKWLLSHGPEKDEQERKADRRLAQYPETLLREGFEARIIALYRRIFAGLEEAGPELIDAHRVLQAESAAEALRKEPSYRYSRELMKGGLAEAALFVAGPVARNRMRDALVNLLDSHSRSGRFPDTLADAPVDPFDSRPLRYRKTEAGFLLYSIGPNLKDDGGDPGPAVGGPPDLVVTYP